MYEIISNITWYFKIKFIDHLELNHHMSQTRKHIQNGNTFIAHTVKL